VYRPSRVAGVGPARAECPFVWTRTAHLATRGPALCVAWDARRRLAAGGVGSVDIWRNMHSLGGRFAPDGASSDAGGSTSAAGPPTAAAAGKKLSATGTAAGTVRTGSLAASGVWGSGGTATAPLADRWEPEATLDVATPVASASFSPDGRFLVTFGRYDRLARLWFTVSRPGPRGPHQCTYLPHPRAVTRAEWSVQLWGRGRAALVTSCRDGRARIWSEGWGAGVPEFAMCGDVSLGPTGGIAAWMSMPAAAGARKVKIVLFFKR
jgi:WD40 repeat protein